MISNQSQNSYPVIDNQKNQIFLKVPPIDHKGLPDRLRQLINPSSNGATRTVKYLS